MSVEYTTLDLLLSHFLYCNVQVWQEGCDTDGDILKGTCTVDIADYLYPRLRKMKHSKASGLGHYTSF